MTYSRSLQRGCIVTALLVLLAVAAAHADRTITVDGYGSDWTGAAPTFSDPAGDGEPGFLDLTDVYTQVDADGLYFLAEFVDPTEPLVQFDLEVRVGERAFLYSVDKHAASGYIGEVTDDYTEIGHSQRSRFAFGDAWEGFVALADLPASGEISLTEIRVMVGACCEYPEWHDADRLTDGPTQAQLEFHPVQRIDDPAAYCGQGAPWESSGMSLPGLPGYAIDHVWASAFSLPFQIDRLSDGSLVIGDRERNRLLHVSENGVSTFLSGVNGSAMATLPDGRVVHYSQHGDVMLLDPETGTDTRLTWLLQSGAYRSPLAADALGRVYYVDPRRSLLRLGVDASSEILARNLPFEESWHVTDLEVDDDGTVYVAGFTRVIAVDSEGSFRTIADGLHYEPVFLDLAADGTLYLNELAKGFQAYSPASGTVKSVENRHGFQDFVVVNVNDTAFYDSAGGYYRLDLETMEESPIARADTLNADAFAAGADGTLYTATTRIASWGGHLVKLSPDGRAVDLGDAVYCRISSADVDATGRLCFIADGAVHRRETDGSITSWPLLLPGSLDLYFARLACVPDGGWVVVTRTGEEVRVYRLLEGGFGWPLPPRFDRTSFGDPVALIDDANVDVGPDGRMALIVTARGTLEHGPYVQRVYQADGNGTGLTEIANLDCRRVAGMVDIAVDPSGVVYVLALTGDTGSGEVVFRVAPGEDPVEAIRVESGRDPRSMDVGADGSIWLGTTLGVFRAYPEVGSRRGEARLVRRVDDDVRIDLDGEHERMREPVACLGSARLPRGLHRIAAARADRSQSRFDCLQPAEWTRLAVLGRRRRTP